MLLATRCPVCGAPGPAPCDGCRARLRPAPALAVPPGLSACHALLAYDGPGRELVARLKYRNGRAALPALAHAMAALVDSAEIDVVTWAPTTVARRRQRGFDQAELLARSVARRLHKPARALLRRRPGPAQTGQPAARRRSGPRFETAKPVAGRVLLVDDVITTGATVTAAALVLSAAGATEVVALAAARTPPRRS